MPETIALSESAVTLLRSCLGGKKPEVIRNREAYRELVAAGLMIPLNTFFGGEESSYRLTEAAIPFFTPPATPAGPLSPDG